MLRPLLGAGCRTEKAPAAATPAAKGDTTPSADTGDAKETATAAPAAAAPKPKAKRGRGTRAKTAASKTAASKTAAASDGSVATSRQDRALRSFCRQKDESERRRRRRRGQAEKWADRQGQEGDTCMKPDPNAAPSARRSFVRRRGDPLPASFYDRPTARVARALLGCVLESRVGGAITRGRIVEVEAYLGPHDAASHAAVGLTARNRHLFGAPGTAYVYRIYGMHWCVNAVTRRVGHGSAVLIRALAPLVGEEVMRQRRGGVRDGELTNGPGKLCQALGITGALDGAPLDRGELQLLRGSSVRDVSVTVTPRIGISQAADWPLRFFLHDDPHVSRTPRLFRRMSVSDADAWLRERALR